MDLDRIFADDLIALGRITRTQGHHGAVRLHPYFDPVERFQHLRGNELIAFQQGTASSQRVLHFTDASFHQGCVILTFDEIPDMTAAETLKGAEILVTSDIIWELPGDEFFAHDLEGYTLTAPAGNVLGTIVRIEAGTAQDLLVVKGPQKEFRVPFAKAFNPVIDRDQRTIQMCLPEGLDSL